MHVKCKDGPRFFGARPVGGERSEGRGAAQRAGGNTAFALLLAVVTNAAALLTVPVLLPALLGRVLPAAAGPMRAPPVVLAGLLRLCLLPLAAGVAARQLIPGAPPPPPPPLRTLCHPLPSPEETASPLGGLPGAFAWVARVGLREPHAPST